MNDLLAETVCVCFLYVGKAVLSNRKEARQSVCRAPAASTDRARARLHISNKADRSRALHEYSLRPRLSYRRWRAVIRYARRGLAAASPGPHTRREHHDRTRQRARIAVRTARTLTQHRSPTDSARVSSQTRKTPSIQTHEMMRMAHPQPHERPPAACRSPPLTATTPRGAGGRHRLRTPCRARTPVAPSPPAERPFTGPQWS